MFESYNNLSNTQLIMLLTLLTVVVFITVVSVIKKRRGVIRSTQPRASYLEIIDTKVIKPTLPINAGYLDFRIVNGDSAGKAIIIGMKLVIAECGASTRIRELQPAVNEFQHDLFVSLRSDQRYYKLNSNTQFYVNNELAEGESVNCRIRLESEEYCWYRFGIEVKWYDEVALKEPKLTRSRDQYIEYAAI